MSKQTQALIQATFDPPSSSEALLRIDGVNAVQLYGVAKMLENAASELLARQAMHDQMEALRAQTGAAEVIPASAEIVRELSRERNGS